MRQSQRGLLVVLLLLTAVARSQQSSTNSDSLFRQSAHAVLSRSFADPGISYLLYDVASGAEITKRWPDDETAIPTGSMVKPFSALAYAQDHDARFPRFSCAGKKTCWLPRGHGKIGITAAIANSCNSYFHQLAVTIHADVAQSVFTGFGLASFSSSDAPAVLAGVDRQWTNTPAAVLNAYIQLLNKSSDSVVKQVLDGMRLSAANGTGKAADRILPRKALVKTGTGACTHKRKAPGDGFAVIAEPADSPRLIILVRQHGVPGSKAAATGARMLALIEGNDAKVD